MDLQISHLFSKLNESQSNWPTNVSLIILYYKDACIEPRLTFSNVFMFCFTQMRCELPSCEQTSWRDQVSSEVWMDHQCVSNSWIFWDWYMRTLFDEVVNLKDIIHLWLAVVCAWLWECLSMNVSNHCSQCFMSVSMLFLELCLSRWR